MNAGLLVSLSFAHWVVEKTLIDHLWSHALSAPLSEVRKMVCLLVMPGSCHLCDGQERDWHHDSYGMGSQQWASFTNRMGRGAGTPFLKKGLTKR